MDPLLVPLMLRPSSSSSPTTTRPLLLLRAASTSTTTAPIIVSSTSRCFSSSSKVPPSSASAPSPAPANLPSKSESPRRGGRKPGPVANLIIMPYTRREWRKVMGEVRTLYVKGQYKQCSHRCSQIIDGVSDPYRVHPLYSTYLCFYAAACIEITACSLHQNSSGKIPLLQQSLSYYKQAESYIEYATFSADTSIIQAAAHHSNHSPAILGPSSIRSSVNSMFSPTSSIRSFENSPFPSPTSSICSISSEMAKPTRSVSNPEVPIPSPLRDSKKTDLPRLPTTLVLAGDLSSSLAHPTVSNSSEDVDFTNQNPEPTNSSISTYLLSRSIAHYRSHISSLSTQLTYHINTVNNLISSITVSRKTRRSNSPCIFVASTDRANAWGGMDGDTIAEVKKVELRARINRLKKQGWKRERFAEEKQEKIELLCKSALEELKVKE